MSDIDRVLGALVEFKDSTRERFDKLEDKVDGIQHLGWKIISGVTVISTVLTSLVQYFLNKKG